MQIRPKGYEVLITPLVANNVYGDVQDVTKEISVEDFIKEKSITTINREIDNGDFDFGIFVYQSVNLVFLNSNGKFSDSRDSRSIFKYSRDRAKVKINFYDGKSNTPLVSFKGMIDDRATTIDLMKEEVKITILSEDSIFNRLLYLEGSIAAGATITNGLIALLNRPEITSVLNIDVDNINVANEYVIDNVEEMSGKITKDIINDLLIASNSIMFVDKDSNVIIRDRIHNSEEFLALYAENDELGRGNFFDITNYNTGLQRTFTTVKFGDMIYTQTEYAKIYGDQEKSLDIPYFTNPLTRRAISQDISNHFKAPKVEFEVTCKTEDVAHLQFLDLVQVNLNYSRRGWNNSKLPLYAQAKYGEAIYPTITGSFKISRNMAFKVIAIEENTQTFYTKLKLRQVGETYEDGFFSTMRPNNIPSKYGLAIYGISKYTEEI